MRYTSTYINFEPTSPFYCLYKHCKIRGLTGGKNGVCSKIKDEANMYLANLLLDKLPKEISMWQCFHPHVTWHTMHSIQETRIKIFLFWKVLLGKLVTLVLNRYSQTLVDSIMTIRAWPSRCSFLVLCCHCDVSWSFPFHLWSWPLTSHEWSSGEPLSCFLLSPSHLLYESVHLYLPELVQWPLQDENALSCWGFLPQCRLHNLGLILGNSKPLPFFFFSQKTQSLSNVSSLQPANAFIFPLVTNV